MNATLSGLSIIIPQYNEQANLGRSVLSEIANFVNTLKYPYEVIIVDDGSTDPSANVTDYFCKDNRKFRQIRIEHQGKAAALLAGINEAKYDWCLLTDMDQSTPMPELNKLIEFTDHNVIIGSRGYFRKKSSLLRKLASVTFTTFRKMFILSDINDTQCGFKLIKTDFAKKLFPLLDVIQDKKPIKGWSVSAFDVEFLFMTEKSHQKIKEVEVEWHDEDISDTKQRKFVRESFDMLKQIMTIIRNDQHGKYRQL